MSDLNNTPNTNSNYILEVDGVEYLSRPNGGIYPLVK